MYSIMEKNRNIHWYCDSCNKRVIKEVSKVKLHQDLMHQNMKEVRNEIEEMKLGLMKTYAKLEIAIGAKVFDVVGKSGTQGEK